MDRLEDATEKALPEKMTERLSSNTLISHYRILSRLGAGGMGEVYLAEDTTLGRRVAVKFLTEAATGDEVAHKRLWREAHTAATLDHPHICHIYEVGQEAGRTFIAMQYIEGTTLSERIKDRPLELRQSLAIAAQVADALADAHRHGIIHRDIKPQNIMITARGDAKLMDFGLAKAIESGVPLETEAETRSILSTPGAVAGTVPYMSPEQIRGASPDGRSDIFSFGAVLYEMLSGQRPFSAGSAPETMSAILTRQPLPLVRYAPDIPAELERIVGKALAKDKDERYQSAQDLLIDLKRLRQQLEFDIEMGRLEQPEAAGKAATIRGSRPPTQEAILQRPTFEQRPASADQTARIGAPPSGRTRRYKTVAGVAALLSLAAAVAGFVYFSGGESIESIAVLPFVNVGGNPDTEYLSDGITDSLINGLSRLPKLKVMSRNSVFRYKGKETDAQQAGNALGVRAVLTGKVMQRSDDLLISVELVNVRDNSHLWGEQYNHKQSDLPAVEAELARDISQRLRLKLSNETQQRLAKRHTENPEAYELYLKGRYRLNDLTQAGALKSSEYFQRAIEKDPSFALAYSGLAEAYANATYVVTTSSISPKEAYSKAKDAALMAVKLDDTLAEAHTSLGTIAMLQEWDWKTAEREFKLAIALNPNSVPALHWYSHYFIYLGRFDDSLAESQRALALDPLDVGMNFHLGFHYFSARQYDQATVTLQKTLEIDQNHTLTHHLLGMVYEQQGQYHEALVEMQKGRELGGGDLRGMMGHVYAVAGQRGEAEKLLAQLLEEGKHSHVSQYNIAMIYAGLGEKEKAFAWLEKAYTERDSNLANLKADPRFDSLRSDARLVDLLRHIGLQP